MKIHIRFTIYDLFHGNCEAHEMTISNQERGFGSICHNQQCNVNYYVALETSKLEKEQIRPALLKFLLSVIYSKLVRIKL